RSPGADEYQKLADEAVEKRKANRRKRRDHKERSKPGHRRRQSAEFANLARVPAFIDETDEQEERSGGNAVVEHLVKRALHALLGERKKSKHNETHVANRR